MTPPALRDQYFGRPALIYGFWTVERLLCCQLQIQSDQKMNSNDRHRPIHQGLRCISLRT